MWSSKVKTPIPGAITKEEIDKAIRTEWKRKWQAAPHYKHTRHFYSRPNKNKAKNIEYIKITHNKADIYHHRLQLFKLYTIQSKPNNKPLMQAMWRRK